MKRTLKILLILILMWTNYLIVFATETAEEQPVEEQPAEEQPVEEQPVEEQPAEEQPVEEQPVEEQPAEEQSVEEDTPSGWAVVSPEGLVVSVIVCTESVCGPSGSWGGVYPSDPYAGYRLVKQTNATSDGNVAGWASSEQTDVIYEEETGNFNVTQYSDTNKTNVVSEATIVPELTATDKEGMDLSTGYFEKNSPSQNAPNEEELNIFRESLNSELKENQDFVHELSDEDKVAFEYLLENAYSDKIEIISNDSEGGVSIEGLLLNSDLNILISGGVLRYNINIEYELAEIEQEILDNYLNENNLAADNIFSVDVNIDQILDDTFVSLTEFKEALTITSPFPEQFNDLDDLTIVHIHDNEVEQIDVNLNEDGTYSFTTNKLSSFTLIQSTPLTTPLINEKESTSYLWLYGLGLLILAGLRFGYTKLKRN